VQARLRLKSSVAVVHAQSIALTLPKAVRWALPFIACMLASSALAFGLNSVLITHEVQAVTTSSVQVQPAWACQRATFGKSQKPGCADPRAEGERGIVISVPPDRVVEDRGNP
jgi:hypothetical protein